MNNFFKFILVPLILFLFFFNLYKSLSAGYASTFHVDEYSWIARGYFFELLLKGDFDNPLWDTYGEKPAEGVDGDPKLAPYVYGIFAYPQYLGEKKAKGGSDDYDFIKFLVDKNILTGFMNQNVAKEYEEYKKEAGFIEWDPYKESGKTFQALIDEFGEGFRETADFILRLRIVSYFFTALSVAAGYLIVLTVTNNLPMSILTSVFYGASRIVMDSTYYARTEGLFLFLFNLGILFLIVILSKKVSSKWLLVVFALDSALCNQTKLNGVLLVFMFNVLVIFAKVLRSNYGERAKKWLFNIFVVNLLFALFYIGLNPSLYKNPLRNLSFQYSWTYRVAQILQEKSSEERLDNPLERIGFISKSFFEKQGLPPAFMGQDQKDRINLLTTPFLLVLFVAGFSRLAAKTVDESRRLFKNAKFTFSSWVVFFCIFLLILFSTSLYLLLAWERYLVHLVLPVWLVIFYGLIFASSSLFAKTKRNSLMKVILGHLKKF